MMKYINLILLFTGILLLLSCEDKDKEPVLNVQKSVQIIYPTEGSSYIVSEEVLDSNFVIMLNPPVFNFNVASPTYHVELDLATNDFSNAITLATTLSDTVEVQYKLLNRILIENFGLLDSASKEFKLRIVAFLGDKYNTASELTGITITSYIDTANMKPVADTLYLVGDATLVGWNNAAGLPIINDGSGSIYTITTSLTAGGMKFLRRLRAWAPQWGTDATGTSAGGPLIYRPDEATTDPTNIPSPGIGIYRIDVDIENLTYTITGV
jgi:starch-binding outer membrane protein SusE/F